MRPNLFTMLKMKMCFALLLVLSSVQVGWSQFTVSGTIMTEDGAPVSGVSVGTDLPSGAVTVTDANGYYELVVPAGSDFNVVPYYNADPLNGVSTFDMVKITNHIQGIGALDSPYKIIAADVNSSSTISAFDIVEIRNLIWVIIQSFPNNSSWRFVEASYAFPDPTNPFASALPETVGVNDVNADIPGLDFIAIKVGDVNGTAITTLNPNTAFMSNINGNIFHDVDATCTETVGDTPLQNWKVRAVGANGTYYGSTQETGVYNIYLPEGTYDVQVIQPNLNWEACTETILGVTAGLLPVNNVDFAVQPVAECPAMEVELSTTFLRRCFENAYFVQYCNQGTLPATDASLEITLDSFFTNVTSTLPWTLVNGNTYTFELGDVDVNECGGFWLTFLLSCDAELGQTHCTYAHVYPDSSCVPPSPLWSGADLVVTGECVGDEILFTITNTGEDMTEPVEYVVIEDVMIQMSVDDLLLEQGETRTVTVPANGATWRLEAAEAAFHPFETFASATVEGCGTNGNGTVSLGFVNLFPMADGKPYEDLDCQPNIGSYDPNDKTGLPLGVEDEHYIERGQDITYTIRFQNTGTDTAFNIVIIDELPASLDPATLRLLGSSHPFEFLLHGEGRVKFLFADIMLPDSNVNELLSHGFVKFSIAQKPDLPLGTTIENEAAIFFDFNEPIITNRTLHTLGENFLVEVAATNMLANGAEMEVFPNPLETMTNFRFKGVEISDGMLTVFDQQGRPVKSMRFTGDICRFDGTGLSSGVYYFRVDNAGRGIATGKVVVK